jgi:hypothetical protein
VDSLRSTVICPKWTNLGGLDGLILDGLAAPRPLTVPTNSATLTTMSIPLLVRSDMALMQPNRVEEVARGSLPSPLIVTAASSHHSRLCLALESLIGLVGLLGQPEGLGEPPEGLAEPVPGGSGLSGGSVSELLSGRRG